MHAGDRQLAVRTPAPAISNVRIVADQREPDWIGEIQADLANVSQNRVLTGARIKVVVLNAGGDIAGGGTASMSGSLPPGARQFVKVTSGVRLVAIADASSALVTVEPRYESG